ncbi:MAG: acyl-CoA thioesterase [Opitutaceae bacterium]|jgi:1,4-dihydroxy-2-naphthoyl-CoA hydrolase|nr:acyl-CoA thioesterase [Opitutaceae bacterium]
MPFSYQRTIHFPDTDAAGVVFFARYLSICHEAYEEALGAAGIGLQRFAVDPDPDPDHGHDHGVVVPVSKSEATYLRPLVCGEKIRVEVTPRALSENSFAVDYVMVKSAAVAVAGAAGAVGKRVALVRTEHVCIASATRERRPLPPALAAWVQAG